MREGQGSPEVVGAEAGFEECVGVWHVASIRSAFRVEVQCEPKNSTPLLRPQEASWGRWPIN